MLTSIVVLVLCACIDVMQGNVVQSDLFQYRLDRAESYFEEFIVKFERHYKNAEEKQKRFHIFKQTLAKINELIRKAGKDMFAVSEFADYTPEEIRQRFPPLPTDMFSSCTYEARNRSREPSVGAEDEQGEGREESAEYVDWVAKGVVTPVKHQGNCGTCWAFTSIGATESAYAIKTGTLLNLSEQEITDCSPHSRDCNTGAPLNAGFEYAVDNGVTTASEYPYTSGFTGQKGECRTGTSRAVRLRGCVQHHIQDEENLKTLLASKGPLGVHVAASSEEFRYYKGSVLENCPESPVNHGVVLVGYGEEDGVPFWKLKNSWGPGWGEQGFIRVKRGVNACNMVAYGIFEALV